MAGTRERIRSTVRNKLRQQILSLDAGEALPPVRDLMRLYNIGRPSIDALFGEFEREALIVRKSRSGVFRSVCSGEEKLVPYVDIIVSNVSGSVPSREQWYSHGLMIAFAEEATAHRCGVRTHYIKAMEDNHDTFHELFKRRDFLACIIVNQMTTDVTQLLDRYGVAWVSLFPQLFVPQRHSVLDNPDLVKIQMDHLISLGHTRIAMLDPVHPKLVSFTAMQRRESYFRIMAEHGFKVEPGWLVFGDGETGSARAFAQMFNCRPMPTAVICGGFAVTPLYKVLHSMGLVIGEDIAVIANDDLPFLESMNPPVTSVSNNPTTAAAMAFELLECILTNRPCKDGRCIPLELIRRGTSCPPRSRTD